MQLFFTVYQTSAGEYYFKLKTPAGEWLLRGNKHPSAGFTRKDIADLRLAAGKAGAYERRMTLTNCFQFIIKNPEGFTIAKSAPFASAHIRDKTMELVKSLAREALINDLT